MVELATILSQLQQAKSKDKIEESIELFLLRVTKKKTEIYKQEANDTTKGNLFGAVLESFSQNNFSGKEIHPYDVTITKNNVLQEVEVKQFVNVKEMVAKFDDESQYSKSTKGLSEERFQYYLLSITFGEHTYKFIGVFSNVLALKKKIVFGNFSDEKINLSNNDNVIGFNKKIDLFIYDDEYIILNSAGTKFENIFKMDKLFAEEAEKILTDNDDIKKVFTDDTIKQLKGKIKNGKRIAARLMKIAMNSDRLSKTVSNISKIKDVIEDENHIFYSKVKDVVYDKKSGKISVADNFEIQLINAISDAFYKAIMSEEEAIDEGRM